ncbi:MAG: hypothetical protein HFG60_06640 [Lachnospiraceae bacterium]|nr:hypothetical protein [Lachnospiraceae bacterium]MCI9184406.1 hypothetical protein [Lachnospiraceae bacterium]
MKIKVNVKHMGKRKNSIEEKTCEIAGRPGTVRELVLAVVDSQVEEYNQRLEASQKIPEILSCLTKEEIEDKAQGGKVGFGQNYGEKKADRHKARDNAIQCFEDGIYRIFMDGKPLENLEDAVDITEENLFTFVRLTMLAGRMW